MGTDFRCICSRFDCARHVDADAVVAVCCASETDDRLDQHEHCPDEREGTSSSLLLSKSKRVTVHFRVYPKGKKRVELSGRMSKFLQRCFLSAGPVMVVEAEVHFEFLEAAIDNRHDE